jgi:hypothetical protein
MVEMLAGFLAGVMLFALGVAAGFDMKAWEGSTNPETKERYIPVELWAGAEWDGKRELKMPKVDGNYRHPHAQYQIKGPVEYKHPVTGQTFFVYERINPGKDGVKWQLFTINQDQTGLGRLYDGRPGRDKRLASGGLKFPLRFWKQGETKKFVYKVYQDSQEWERAESITIKQIDFSFQGSSHCLEFYWTATDRDGKKTYDRQTYIYCPGKSMVSQIQH